MALEQRNLGEQIFHATSVSEGVGMARCVVFYRKRPIIIERTIAEKEVPFEIERFEKAILETSKQILEIGKKVKAMMGADHADIFESHQMVLEDQVFLDEVVKAIEKEKLPADLATQRVSLKYVKSFESISDEYFRQRVEDVKDVTTRLMDNLIGWGHPERMMQLTEPTILVASDLTPSQTVQIDRNFIKGIITEQGGVASHVAILARSLRIPAVTGLARATEIFRTGQSLLLDGYRGTVILTPSEETSQLYGQRIEQEEVLTRELANDASKPVATLDGLKILLAANLAQPEDVVQADAVGALGVGLFRTEFFFLNRDTLPTEEEQYEVYRKVATSMGDKPVVIRTLDLGGDKRLPLLDIPVEENPFLGCRAIRYCINNPAIFKVQLRALLRAGADAKNLQILYPMISGVGEFEQARKILQECMNELEGEGVAFNPDIKEGIMIEIPSAVVCAEELAKRASFFSIGTNDLIQYTLAVDRMNPHINYLYQPTHPAIIRLISSTISAARRGREGKGISLSVCGEMGGTPELTPLLIGLGVDELSVSVPQIMKIRRMIQKVSFIDCHDLATRALQMNDPNQIWELSSDFAKGVAPELFSDQE